MNVAFNALAQNFDNHINQFYSSGPFLAEAAVAAPFLQNLQPFLGNRSTNFTNMVCPFPYRAPPECLAEVPFLVQRRFLCRLRLRAPDLKDPSLDLRLCERAVHPQRDVLQPNSGLAAHR